MKKIHFLFFTLIGFLSCNSNVESNLPDHAKPVNIFAKAFIEKIISGQADGAISNVDSTVPTHDAIASIKNASKILAGEKIKQVKLLECKWTFGISSNTGKSSTYQLTYEYQLQKATALFALIVKENNNNFSVSAFDGKFIDPKLSESNAFSLEGKSILHYAFVFLCIAIPLFIVATFIMMLKTKITNNKKIMWGFIILLLAIPKFALNWSTGEIDFKLLNFSIFGGGAYKESIYTAWFIFFNLPIGALIFWIKRRDLQNEAILDEEYNSFEWQNPNETPKNKSRSTN